MRQYNSMFVQGTLAVVGFEIIIYRLGVKIHGLRVKQKTAFYTQRELQSRVFRVFHYNHTFTFE